MKRFWTVTLLLAIASMPSLAQDDGGGGGFGGFGEDFDSGPDFGGGIQLQEMADPINQLREVLAKANITLNRDQERALQPVIERTIRAMQELRENTLAEGRGQGGFQGRGFPGGGARGAGAAPEGFRGGRGGRGAEAAEAMRGQAGAMMAADPRMRELNDQFETEMRAILTPDQTAAWDAYKREQAKEAGGLEALKIILEDARAPALTAEQERQIGGLYAELQRSRMRLMMEGGGEADPDRVRQLETETSTSVLRALNTAQRQAMLEMLRSQQQ